MKNFILIFLIITTISSCTKIPWNGHHHPENKSEIVYLESNDYADYQNKVIAYRNDGSGALEEIPGSPFTAGGSGVGDVNQTLGPLDSDNQLKISEDGHFLLAVNSGSHSIAVFRIGTDGALSAVPGSPFPSGGQTPVSIGLKDRYVYVANKSQDLVHHVTAKPNYTVFTIDENGSLTPLANSTIETTEGSSPAQALVSHKGSLLFGADFLGFMLKPAVGSLRSFTIQGDGTLHSVEGTPQMLPEMGGALGLTESPKDNTLYVGFPVVDKVGVYDIDEATGKLTFLKSVASGPAACWLRTAHSGDNLYALNSGENSISVFNSSSPKNPVLLSKLILKQSGPLYSNMAMDKHFTTSQAFSFEFSPHEQYLYVVSQHTNKDFSVGNYNYLHVLEVAKDGNLSESREPILLPVANMYRPQGVVVWPAKE